MAVLTGQYYLDKHDRRYHDDLKAELEGFGTVSHPNIRISEGRNTTLEVTQLYADDRGVTRVYRGTLTEEGWRLERAAPDFHQRFFGEFGDDDLGGGDGNDVLFGEAGADLLSDDPQQGL